MKRVLHIVRANALAGAENHIFMLLPKIAERGYQVTLLTLTDGRKGNQTESYQKKLKELQLAGIDVIEEAIKNKFDFFAIPKLKNAIEKINPFIVHTHMPYADLFGAFAARLANIKYIVASRHYDYSISKAEQNKFKLFYWFANKMHNKTIPISQKIYGLCNNVERIPQNKIKLVLYGCDDQKVDKQIARLKLLKELNLPKEIVILGTVARLISWKGHTYAIEAMRKISKENGNVLWLFIGDGPDRIKLEQLVSSFRLGDKIRFLGYRDDIPELMAGMDVMVHPTLGEGFGLILLEAMIQSTPIISTKTGAIPEVVEDGQTGMLVESKNAESLAKAIFQLINSPELRQQFGLNGRKRYEKHFTSNIMSDKIINIYDKLY